MSQVSPAEPCTTPSPQLGEQSASVRAVQPSGQHPSGAVSEQFVRVVTSQRAEQVRAVPTRFTSRQAEGSGAQLVGQLASPIASDSQASPGSMILFGQNGWQSLSVEWLAPGKQ